MSFQLDWNAIRSEESSNSLRRILNEKLSNIDATGIIEGIQVEELVLGTTAPELFIEDISDPEIEFTFNSPVNVNHSPADICSPEECVQLTLGINYTSPIRMVLRGDIVLNRPGPKFMSLPIKICLKEITIIGKVLFSRIGDFKFISIKRQKDSQLSFQFDSEIGDPSRHGTRSLLLGIKFVVLKNVGKVESFAQSIVSKLIDSILVFPNFIKI